MSFILKVLVLMTRLLNINKGCFTKTPIYRLTDNSVERLKVSFVELSVDNRIYERNHSNADFDDLPFDDNERLIVK